MIIRAKRQLYNRDFYGLVTPGQTFEAPDWVAKKLIGRNLAQPVVGQKCNGPVGPRKDTEPLLQPSSVILRALVPLPEYAVMAAGELFAVSESEAVQLEAKGFAEQYQVPELIMPEPQPEPEAKMMTEASENKMLSVPENKEPLKRKRGRPRKKRT